MRARVRRGQRVGCEGGSRASNSFRRCKEMAQLITTNARAIVYWIFLFYQHYQASPADAQLAASGNMCLRRTVGIKVIYSRYSMSINFCLFPYTAFSTFLLGGFDFSGVGRERRAEGKRGKGGR